MDPEVTVVRIVEPDRFDTIAVKLESEIHLLLSNLVPPSLVRGDPATIPKFRPGKVIRVLTAFGPFLYIIFREDNVTTS